MRKPSVIALLAAGCVGLMAAPALSHHSHSMFDHTVEKTIQGTVTAFSYRNPHVYLYVEVKGDDGKVETWAIEMSPISIMLNRGIKQTTFKVGDVVTVTVNPLRNGRPGGNYTTAIAADGKKYD